MEKSFHGRTIATLSATGQTKIHQGFDPLLTGFKHVPFNDAKALRDKVTPFTCAVMVEPIQGEGGVNCPKNGYIEELRSICDEKGLLLIFDEVQVGMGRTGKLFAYENFAAEPDILTLAKSLAGGVPMGAMLAKEKVAASFSPGTHASTFGGNPLASAAGVAAVKILTEEGILENCREVSAFFFEQLNGLKEKYSFIKEVRGKGLIIGMEINFPGEAIVETCRENGVLINCVSGNILRFLPPLLVSKKEVKILIELLDRIFSEIEKQ